MVNAFATVFGVYTLVKFKCVGALLVSRLAILLFLNGSVLLLYYVYGIRGMEREREVKRN